jgi:hypothetical protein
MRMKQKRKRKSEKSDRECHFSVPVPEKCSYEGFDVVAEACTAMHFCCCCCIIVEKSIPFVQMQTIHCSSLGSPGVVTQGRRLFLFQIVVQD